MKEKFAPFEALAADFKKNAEAVGQAMIGRMNVVSRAEFEAQNAILAQAVADMRRIEKKLDELLAAQSGAKPPIEK